MGNVTAAEFEAAYAARSGVTVEQLHAWGRYAEPCDCDSDMCQGWAMGHQQEDAIAEDQLRATRRYIAAHRETWPPGTTAWFEYHCWESPASGDAALWFRSHQQVTVLGRDEDENMGATMLDRADAGCPNVYIIRFADGHEGGAVEDELLNGPEFFFRPGPNPRYF
jgi:hypothetical protein